ncbi:bifunctional hydroxymethylpyrimidine kinase/phosphomethylpyrimidine kinase [Shewanella marina]|uniref:bifunctional hydroxymethylpyrimidine kinase/phosphomethylpyrimidine kinase n=1 Tax=Shewanella marina TaxID=487319 RepID=UPI00046FB36C|nr:bifunctional hydroxymethylpyrimidine kinase/phosphomethylpyrimidine kinase [Shewanella marina]
MINTPITLTIAGSDSGGGAGIQADIKTISATGAYACSVITALTAQNTLGVQAVLAVDADFVKQQLDAVFTDLAIDSVKIGMLNDTHVIKVVADALRRYQPKHIVLDPVMVATSGDKLLQDDALLCMQQVLFPLVDIITPNLPEAAALIGARLPTSTAQMHALLPQLQQLLQRVNANAWLLLKGGHLQDSDQCVDLLTDGNSCHQLSGPRYPTHNTHGTGCSLSAAIASYLAQGDSMLEAVSRAKQYLAQAIKYADQLNIGHGHGPINHFYQQTLTQASR